MKSLLFSAAMVAGTLCSTQVGIAQTPASESCMPKGGLSFICGPKHPEDIVVLPGGRWLIASGYAKGGGLHRVDTRTKVWWRWIAPMRGRVEPGFPDCAGPPDPENFLAHGLALRPSTRGRARLYVVSHGARESIEVFDVRSTRAEPSLVWRGCVLAPNKVEFNSVVATPEGAILATVLVLPGKSLADAFEGKVTGAVFEWRRGDAGFRQIEGTGLPANNGIEISSDGSTVYVISSTLRTLTAFSRGAAWRELWSIDIPDMLPDNVRWGPNNKLFVAGMTYDEPTCGGPVKVVNGQVDLTSCARGFRVVTIDPENRSVINVAKGEAGIHSGAATAIPSGGYLWISSFATNRLAYMPWH